MRIVLVLLAAISLTACGGDDDDAQPPAASNPGPPASTTPADRGGRSDRTGIRITFGDTVLTGRLDDNATARDLADQLPVTLTFRDHNGIEKTAPLPRRLSVDGTPPGHDPAAGDIGYWAPDGDLVFYYDDAAPYFDGIVRIGEIEGDLATLERQVDGATVTVTRSTER
jgi:hypothetical protein